MPVGAIIGGAAITAGGGMYAASKGASAAKKEGQLTADATQATIASNERLAAQARADNEPFRQAGVSSLSALGSAFGLPGYGAPSMTGQTYASTPVPNAGGVSMTGKTPGAMTANYGTPQGGDTMMGQSGGPSMTGVEYTQQPAISAQPAGDYDAYLQQNPDVMAWAQQKVASGEFPTLEAAAQSHYEGGGKAEGRVLPPAPYQAAPGYSDPTAPQGYGSPERPAGYTAPARMADPTLDVSAGAYQTSPGYEWQLEQGQRGLDHAAAAGGGIMSGARQKAALRYSQGLANQDYTDWRNYTTSQFNVDRSRGDNIYADDRAFGYGQNRDSQSDFQTDRAYTTGRYDTRNSQLMSLAGFGQNANAANTNAATSFAQNSNAARMAGAQAQGAAGVNAANAYGGAVNNLMTTGAYLGGQYLSGSLGGSGFTNTGNLGSSFNFTPWS